MPKRTVETLFIALLTAAIWSLLMLGVAKVAEDHQKAEQQRLRNNFSPMSTSPEVQEAYDAIR